MSSPSKLRPLEKCSHLTPLPNSPYFADVRLSKQLSGGTFQLHALTNPAPRIGTTRPNPAHLEQRPHPLCGRTDQQTDLQQARGQHVLHGTAGTGRLLPCGQRLLPSGQRRLPALSAARARPAGWEGAAAPRTGTLPAGSYSAHFDWLFLCHSNELRPIRTVRRAVGRAGAGLWCERGEGGRAPS